MLKILSGCESPYINKNKTVSLKHMMLEEASQKKTHYIYLIRLNEERTLTFHSVSFSEVAEKGS